MHERRPYEEIPASNIVIKEVSILDTENERSLLGARSKKKTKSGPKKDAKEQKKQQTSTTQAQPLVKEPQSGMKLYDFELAAQQIPENAFTKVESKAHKLLRKGNKVEPAPDAVIYHGSLDRLDEISISGPRPDGRDNSKGSRNELKIKQDNSKRTDVGQKRKLQQPVQQLVAQGSKVGTS